MSFRNATKIGSRPPVSGIPGEGFWNPNLGYYENGDGVIGGGSDPIYTAPAQIACDEGYEAYVTADGRQDCRPIGVRSNTTVKPLQTAIINSVNPVIATNQPTVIDSITAKAKSNPYIALGIAGFLVYLFTRKSK